MLGDLSVGDHCNDVVRRTVAELGGLDILVNNIAYQNPDRRGEPPRVTGNRD